MGSGDVLVISETGRIEAALVSSLRNSGYSVHVVTAASDCLSAINKYSPEAILLSVFSDIINPSSLLGCIRKNSDVPVILVRDTNLPSKIAPLLKQGATGYFSVPESDTQLLPRIIGDAITERRERIRQAENARRLGVLERDQREGLRVQNNLLPSSPAALGDIRLSHYIRPCLILGGDSVDYFGTADGKVVFYLADVSGHGAAGAIVSVTLTALSRRLEHEFAELGLDTSSRVLSWYNRELLRLGLEQHVTMFLGILDTTSNTLQYSNAGHFPAAILQQADETVYLELGGLPLGVCETEYDFLEVKIAKIFNLVIFSDGVLEIIDKRTLKEKEEYLLSLVQCGHTEIESLVKHLRLEVTEDVPDDIAVFTVVRKN